MGRPNHADLSTLRSDVDGPVITQADDDYARARTVWNGMIDRHPWAIVRAAGPEDVAAAVAFAADRELPLAVRGGGHGVAGAGTVDDGLVIDLASLDGVDVEGHKVRVGGGVTLGRLDRATNDRGVVVPAGVVSKTGIGGLALGGGIGWLTRSFGLTADHLLDADVVTASGRMVRASEDPDLLWGLRGGGGNFGVVTRFTFRAHAFPREVFAGNLVYGMENWRAALSAWSHWAADLPDAMQTITSILVPPPAWELGDAPVLVIAFVWNSSDDAAGEALVRELTAVVGPDVTDTGTVAWTSWQSSLDDLFPHGSRAYWKNTSFSALDDDVIDILIGLGRAQTWLGTGIDIHHMGGAYARVPRDVTAFPDRADDFWLNLYGFWTDPGDDDHHRAFVRDVYAAMAPHRGRAQYINFMGGESAGESCSDARGIYGDENLARLRSVKARYDPGNLFRLNHNIPPG